MKKFFEKHDLFKIVSIVILFTVVLTWIIPGGYQGESGFVTEGLSRIGITDLFVYGLLALYYFAILVTLLLIIGGFYQLLAKTKGYQSLVEKTTKFLKGKEIPFVLVTSFVFAALAAISTEIYQLFIFIPFIVTIILKLKMSKITALCTTFGSILVGVIGSVYSVFMYDSVAYYLGVAYSDGVLFRVIVFVVTYILFNVFNVLYIRKTAGKNLKDEKTEDLFEVEKPAKNAKAWPIIVVLAIIAIFQIIGYIGWETVFEISVFKDFDTWLTTLAVGDHTVVSYILGTSSAFGAWDLYVIQVVLIIASIVVAIMYKIGLDEFIDSFTTGAKKMLKVIILILMVLVICVLTVMYPIFPTIADWIMGLTKSFNVYLAALSSFITSIFSVEFRYTNQAIAGYMVSTFANTNGSIIALAMQTAYGLVQFVAPTSVILIAGLTYLDIPYKQWLKYIWKFFVALLVVILIILTIVVYV